MTDLIDAIGSRIASTLWLARAAMQPSGRSRVGTEPARPAVVARIGG